jgi:nucleoside-diphosphate-sugar epimerase
MEWKKEIGMRIIDKTKPVLITGGTGYLASWIIKMLLGDGIDVHATVRDPSDGSKAEHLKALGGASKAQLKLYRADLMDPGSFDEAMQGCELVIHTAAPFFITGIKDAEEELIRPALEGTKNVLEAVNRTATLKRVVLTSSVVAIFGDNADIELAPGGIFTEKEWNVTSSAGHQPYSYAKTAAEKAAWEIVGKQDRWDLLTINPGWILGPSLSKRNDSTSIRIMIEFADGTYKRGVAELWSGIVDVRDAAAAHIKAGYTPEASGRHILVSEEATLLDIGNILRKHFGDDYPFPKTQAPKLMFWLIAPLFGFTRKFASKNAGVKIKFDNSYSKADLKLSYIPLEQTVKDHFQQILDDGLLE